MRYNQYNYTAVPQDVMLSELQELGFHLATHHTAKENLQIFLTRALFQYPTPTQAFKAMIADSTTDLDHFFQSDQALTSTIFYTIALQLLEFLPFIDFDDADAFCKEIHFPIIYGDIIENLYQLLNTRTKSGNLLIDQLISQGLIPADNHYHFFNGKSLATFTTHDAIREVVYVETRVDTDQDGLADLIKVNILRPRFDGKVPAMMTASPYHQGVNAKASDQALYDMNVSLEKKDPKTISVTTNALSPLPSKKIASHKNSEAQELLGTISTYTLNDYLFSRGFANIYVSGLGTKDSQGLMTNGDYQQIEAFKNVIDWLNGRCLAYTDHTRTQPVTASWANGKVATTGLSYLGTMSNGLATTGVDGLEVIIAEAGISSWYDYYRENGLVTSPGGYPGEDFDSLMELTYSRNLRAGDYLCHNTQYQESLTQLKRDLDRTTGDYNQFWHDRNYLLHTDKVKAEVVFTHGSQDWNVKPLHVFQLFQALPNHIKKHLFFHNGAHVYMNNWQSIDFRETMNALLSQKLLSHPSTFSLPRVIWQDNQEAQNWRELETFGRETYQDFQLGEERKQIQNAYPEQDYLRFSKNYQVFKNELFEGKAQQIIIDLVLDQDFLINGRSKLQLRLKSSIDKGLLSAQLLDYGHAKRLLPIPSPLVSKAMDNGRYYMQEHLMELPFKETPHRVITKGHLNLQNRHNLLTVEEVVPDEWMTFELALQPTIYQLKKGDTVRLLLYTTDFEHTVRDNTDYHITVDLSSSALHIPIEK